jgi:hypothetical protein
VLTLRCEHPGHPYVHRLGPAPYFRLAGTSLQVGPDDRQVGYYARGLWHAGGREFLTLTVESPAAVRFEHHGGAGSGAHGPFELVRLLDGALWYGLRADQLLASYDDESQCWYSHVDQRHCAAAVLMAPAG